MVITKLYGGLGNQMFQYAAGYVLAKKLSANLYPDLSWFDEIKGNAEVTQRQYELGVFGIKPRKIKLADKISLKRRPLKTFKETGLGYNEAFWGLEGNVVLDGYWQSYKYLEDDREDIIKLFEFPKPSPANNKLLDEIQRTQSVSVHVRRGDYANSKHTREYHGLLPDEYYKKAVALMSKKVDNPKFFVFSDDPQWCTKNLKLGKNVVYVSLNSGLSSYEDMRLMAACKHNIIANSSFSWWGAWLNSNEGRTVLAPKKWFLQTDAKLNDRLPPDWMRL